MQTKILEIQKKTKNQKKTIINLRLKRQNASVIIPGRLFILLRITAVWPPLLSSNLWLAITVVAWGLSLTFQRLGSRVVVDCGSTGTDSSPWPVTNSYLHKHTLKKHNKSALGFILIYALGEIKIQIYINIALWYIRIHTSVCVKRMLRYYLEDSELQLPMFTGAFLPCWKQQFLVDFVHHHCKRPESFLRIKLLFYSSSHILIWLSI